MASKPGHPLWLEMLTYVSDNVDVYCNARKRRDRSLRHWAILELTGPYALGRVLLLHLQKQPRSRIALLEHLPFCAELWCSQLESRLPRHPLQQGSGRVGMKATRLVKALTDTLSRMAWVMSRREHRVCAPPGGLGWVGSGGALCRNARGGSVVTWRLLRLIDPLQIFILTLELLVLPLQSSAHRPVHFDLCAQRPSLRLERLRRHAVCDIAVAVVPIAASGHCERRAPCALSRCAPPAARICQGARPTEYERLCRFYCIPTGSVQEHHLKLHPGDAG